MPAFAFHGTLLLQREIDKNVAITTQQCISKYAIDSEQAKPKLAAMLEDYSSQ